MDDPARDGLLGAAARLLGERDLSRAVMEGGQFHEVVVVPGVGVVRVAWRARAAEALTRQTELLRRLGDAACLAWHGWERVRAAVDPVTYRRAGVWCLTFGLEHIAAAILDGEPGDAVERRAARAGGVAGPHSWMVSARLTVPGNRCGAVGVGAGGQRAHNGPVIGFEAGVGSA
jgi:hypothetical protein